MIRSIDAQKCTGCGTCMKTCPLDVFRIDASAELRSPCMLACPAHADIRGYQSRLQMGDIAGAAGILSRTLPFPAITGRVCPHPCEEQCRRGAIGQEAVSINALEQWIGDYMLAADMEIPVQRHIDKVAVVGSGPAGIACAWFLLQMGYPVTIFEEKSRAGGMLRYGIPAYRLPDTILDAVIGQLRKAGARFFFETSVGEGGDITLDDLKERQYRAVFLGLGASGARKPGIPGEDLPQVHSGLEFLSSCRMGGHPEEMPRRVLVIGGGDVAMDAAITARRLGAEDVTVACLEPLESMPAHRHNRDEALQAGIAILPSWGPAEIVAENNGALAIQLRKCVSLLDAEGRFCPVYSSGEQCVTADMVILAVGQTPSTACFRNALLTRNARLVVDSVTMQTSAPAVFAAGDAVTGPASVVSAMAGGREAAISIDRLLKGADLIGMRDKDPGIVPPDRLPPENIPPLPRQVRSDVDLAGDPFAECRRGLTFEQAMTESTRCLTCGATARITFDDDCMTCFSCEVKCPSDAICVHPFKERIPRMVKTSDC